MSPYTRKNKEVVVKLINSLSLSKIRTASAVLLLRIASMVHRITGSRVILQ